MTLEELKHIVSKKLPINQDHLDTEALKNQELYAEFIDYKTNFEFLLAKAKGDYKRLYREKWEYYTGKADPSVYQLKPFNLKILKQDVDKYLKSDDEVIKLESKVTYIQNIVDYLEKTIRIISNRTFQIKNAIEWRKFTSGVI